jgi:hypothetical protein
LALVVVVAGSSRIYEVELPLVAGAVDAVSRMAERWTLALASSSNRPVIDVVLSVAGLTAGSPSPSRPRRWWRTKTGA